MSADWPVVRLGDHVDSSLGKMLDKKKNKGTEHPYLGNSDVRWGYFDLTDLSQMKFEDSESDRYEIKSGDLIVCEGGEPGRCAIWREEVRDMKIQKALHRLRPKATLNNYYLYYWFLLSGSRGLLEPYFTGTTIKHLTGKALKDLEIQLPPLDYQEYVSKVLKSLDDKIQLNRQTNQTLEQIAQAIFKSWFVDFEPTRAKIAAKQEWAKKNLSAKNTQNMHTALGAAAGGNDTALSNEQAKAIFIERAAMAAISGKTLDELDAQGCGNAAGAGATLEQLKATAALFPDSLVDSELGEIPAGWEVKLNGDVMDVRDGTHDSPKQSETGFPLVTSKHITSGVLDIKAAYLISEKDYEKVNKRSEVNQGDILLTMIGTVGIPYLVLQPEVNFAIKNVGLFRTSEARELKNYFYLLLRSQEMEAYLDARMAGTTQKYLSLKVLRSIELLLPAAGLLGAFNNLIDPIMDKNFSALMENESLSELRGSLLPKLLSGELEVGAEEPA